MTELIFLFMVKKDLCFNISDILSCRDLLYNTANVSIHAICQNFQMSARFTNNFGYFANEYNILHTI